MTITVRSFAASEWPLYKTLRLASLADAPDAFGSTLAREAPRTDAEWSSRLAAGVQSPRDFPALAEQSGDPVGLAWGRIEEAEPAVAHLYQVWVQPKARGLGAGRQLLNAVSAWAGEQTAQWLELGVTCGDTPAWRLYQRAGFVPIGLPAPLRPGSPLLAQVMRLRLKVPAP